jgi:hypothetical protein
MYSIAVTRPRECPRAYTNILGTIITSLGKYDIPIGMVGASDVGG